jgi:serine/threonine-protein kinase
VANRKEWERDWEVCSAWKKTGGQGTVSQVVRKGDASGVRYVLKELKSWRDPERRARMRREVVALETLTHPATPRVIAHNTQAFLDLATPLYAVFEYVDGPTLEEFLVPPSATTMSLGAAATLTLRLLDALDACHGAGIGHRDVKPDNIVLRNRAAADPVLIDFGQTFNVDDSAPPTTCIGQQVGNRFLALPEHAPTSGNKRDPRSDLTACCGVLIFALTGVAPAVLTDERQQAPHQRPATRAALDRIAEPARARLMNVFDVGFQHRLDRRWQSVAALRARLEALEAPPLAAATEADVEALRARAEANRGAREILDALDAILARVEQAGREAARRLGGGYRAEIERRPPSMAGPDAWIRCGVRAELEGKTIDTPFMISAVGAEIVVEELFALDRRVTRGRTPIADPMADAGLDEAVAGAVIARVAAGLLD